MKSLTAVEIPSPSDVVIHHKNQFEANIPESAAVSDNDLLSDLNCTTTERVSSFDAERKNFTYSEDTNFSPISEVYEDVSNDPTLPEMKGDSSKIPIPYLQQLNKKFEEMERFRIISTHREPSLWCHPTVIALKKHSDELKICIGFSFLNRFIQRQDHVSNSPFEAATSIPSGELKHFCKFKAHHGFWQVSPAPESRTLTCFITQFGRYVCNQAGINISECYNHRMDKVTARLQSIRRLRTPNHPTLKKCVHAFLDQCRQHGVVLKQKKSQIAVTKVEFGGYRLFRTGIQSSPDLLKSIRDFPRLRNLTDLRSWFALVNQLRYFSKDLTKIMEPFRPLLKKYSVFQWFPEHEDAFADAKCV